MIKLFGPDNEEMMVIHSLRHEDDTLVIDGKIYGAMPLTAKLHPDAARAFLKMLTPGLIWFLLTLPFRRTKQTGKPGSR